MNDNDTAAWSGFMEERANSTWSGSPARATTAPCALHTATWPRWIDSSMPERITRARTAAPLTGSRRDLREVFLVAALQLLLEGVVHGQHCCPGPRDHPLLLGEAPH